MSSTNNILDDVPFIECDICNIIKELNPKQAHEYDDISIQMIQMCKESGIKPFFKIQTNYIAKAIYPQKRRKNIRIRVKSLLFLYKKITKN